MRRPVLLGLTGSIGMGKSTTAALFAEAGVPVWDADITVHALYAEGGAAVGPVGALCPDAIRQDAVDRTILKAHIARDPALLRRLENSVHPLVTAHRAGFIAAVAALHRPLALLDIPLLFETGAEGGLDAVVVVTAPPDIQRARVLSRPGMDGKQLALILGRQMPDAEKRARATYIVETTTLDAARAQVAAILKNLEACDA